MINNNITLTSKVMDGKLPLPFYWTRLHTYCTHPLLTGITGHCTCSVVIVRTVNEGLAMYMYNLTLTALRNSEGKREKGNEGLQGQLISISDTIH